MRINSINEFRAAIRQGLSPYAWPGGYPCFFVMSDGEALSFTAAKAQKRQILEALRDHDNSGWRPVALEINWEDSNLVCAHTNQRIECAYDTEESD